MVSGTCDALPSTDQWSQRHRRAEPCGAPVRGTGWDRAPTTAPRVPAACRPRLGRRDMAQAAGSARVCVGWPASNPRSQCAFLVGLTRERRDGGRHSAGVVSTSSFPSNTSGKLDAALVARDIPAHGFTLSSRRNRCMAWLSRRGSAFKHACRNACSSAWRASRKGSERRLAALAKQCLRGKGTRPGRRPSHWSSCCRRLKALYRRAMTPDSATQGFITKSEYKTTPVSALVFRPTMVRAGMEVAGRPGDDLDRSREHPLSLGSSAKSSNDSMVLLGAGQRTT
mmetsp:Transcript_48881/g.110795  ORF Transcript_48881/g.110795 Transcript_48881/m.110795 type:complete len:283 (-) Transcript_48881:14-862(-)